MSELRSELPIDEQFDSEISVECNPAGAWKAIQKQAAQIDALRLKRHNDWDEALKLCRMIVRGHGYFLGLPGEQARTNAILKKINARIRTHRRNPPEGSE